MSLRLFGRAWRKLHVAPSGVIGMPRFVRTIPILLAFGVFAFVRTEPASAQAPDPVADPAAPAPNAPADSPLLKEPQTPEELFAATLLMTDLARMDLARKYLDLFAAGKPDGEVLLQLRDKHGTAEFVRLSRIPELRPTSSKLLTELEVAARTRAADPAFVDGLITKLAGDPVDRELAIRDLTNLGQPAVPALVARLATPKSDEERDHITYALIRMGRQVVPPVLGTLEAPDEAVRTAAISVLGWLRAGEAVPYLWYPAFGPEQPEGVKIAAAEALARIRYGKPQAVDRISSIEAAGELRKLATEYFDQTQEAPLDDDGQAAVWTWDADAGTVAKRLWPPRLANLWYATRFSRESLALSPTMPEVQEQFLAALLGLEVESVGIDQPLPESPGSPMYLAMTAGEAMLVGVLKESLAARQTGAALAAVRGLSAVGTRDVLNPKGGLRSPVLSALNYPDDRVQFETAVTILRQEPTLPFAGADRVVDILRRALLDGSEPKAIVIDADQTRSSQVKGFLASSGYDTQVVRSGREGFLLAAEMGAVNFVVVQVNVARWGLSQTIANFRADARTAAIPLVIYGAEEDRTKLRRLVSESAPAVFAAESPSEADFLREVKPFLKSIAVAPLSSAERQTRRTVAAYWLAEIASSGSRVFHLTPAEPALSSVAEDAQLSTNALIGLGGIGTAESQRRLSEVALNGQLPEAMRVNAALQLGQHVQRYGLLLSKSEVEGLQAGWKLVETPRLKAALAAVIGSLQPGSRVLSERLQEFPWRTTVGQ